MDYEAIRRGQAPDVDIAPRAIVNTFVRTLAANEGAIVAVPGGRANIVTPVSGP